MQTIVGLIEIVGNCFINRRFWKRQTNTHTRTTKDLLIHVLHFFLGLIILITNTIASGQHDWEYPKARDNGVMPGKPLRSK